MMSRGSLPVVEFQAMPAIVESPMSDTGGASTGGVAAAATPAGVMTETEVIRRTAATAARRGKLVTTSALERLPRTDVYRHSSCRNQDISRRPGAAGYHTSPSRQS